LEEEKASAAEDEEHMMILASLASLYAERNSKPQRGGSASGRQKAKARQHLEGYIMLYADYFTDEPLHLEAVFRRRFGMRRDLFLKIMYAIRNLDLYFRCKPDCTDMIGFSSLQKCTVAMRLLACGAPGGNADDYLCMAESTVIDCLYKFCRTIIAVFGELYLISPTTQDTERILAIKAASGFPVILGSIDCMHWRWENFPFAWQGRGSGR
jgi:hypothetical protein